MIMHRTDVRLVAMALVRLVAMPLVHVAPSPLPRSIVYTTTHNNWGKPSRNRQYATPVPSNIRGKELTI